jgi:hypothetical protein
MRIRTSIALAFAAAATAGPALAVTGHPSGPPGAGTYGRGDTGVVTVSSEAHDSEGEEPLAANPLNPDELTTVANVFQPVLPAPASMYVGGSGVQDSRLYVSRDGGRHWRTLKLDVGGIGEVDPPDVTGARAPEFSDAFNVLNTDSDVAWDQHGNAYFSSGDVHGVHHDGNEVETVWRSADGGRTWGPNDGYTAVNATTEEHTELDRPWLAADNTGGRHDGRLYTTFETTPFVDIPPQVYAKHSDDHGVTWSRSVRVDDGIYETQWNPRARPVVDASGALDVVYDRGPVTATPFAAYDGPIQLMLARSTDGGATFSRVPVDDDVRRVTSPDEATSAYTEMIPAMAADPRHGGHIAVAWPQALGVDNSRIVLRYTVDGGRHWSPRVDIADDPAAQPDQHDHVTLSWLGDGRLFVGWRDRRYGGGAWTGNYDEWVRALALNGRGVRFGPPVRFTVSPQPPTSGGRTPLQPDEFQGLVATVRGVALTWSQLGADGLDHLVFRRIPLAAFTR